MRITAAVAFFCQQLTTLTLTMMPHTLLYLLTSTTRLYARLLQRSVLLTHICLRASATVCRCTAVMQLHSVHLPPPYRSCEQYTIRVFDQSQTRLYILDSLARRDCTRDCCSTGSCPQTLVCPPAPLPALFEPHRCGFRAAAEMHPPGTSAQRLRWRCRLLACAALCSTHSCD